MAAAKGMRMESGIHQLDLSPLGTKSGTSYQQSATDRRTLLSGSRSRSIGLALLQLCLLLCPNLNQAFSSTSATKPRRFLMKPTTRLTSFPTPLLDVALDQPMPIYFDIGSKATKTTGVFGIRRLAVIFVAVLLATMSKSLVERAFDMIQQRRNARSTGQVVSTVETTTTSAVTELLPPAPALIVEDVVVAAPPEPAPRVVPKVVVQPLPMPFDNEGWGVATIRSKQRFGTSGFIHLDFELPDPSYFIPLDLGEPISLCCLDDDDEPVQADFFPLPAGDYGSVSVLVKSKPDISSGTVATTVGDVYSWGDRQQDEVAQVILHDLEVGDQVAIRPSGATRLEYLGEHLPLTSIVYWAVGTGIVPVLDQLRTVLNNDDFAIDQASVIWVNRQADDFDILEQDLEEIYDSSPELLNVACVVDEEMEFSGIDIENAVASFHPGMMAVISGPAETTKTALNYLQVKKNFPRDCICTL